MIIIIIISIKLWLLHERLPTSENGGGGGGEEVIMMIDYIILF